MYNDFEKWLDAALEQKLPEGIRAFNFNLYEDGNDTWSIELVACDQFDAEDQDWACSEIFATREEPLTWVEAAGWETILSKGCTLVELYLEEGRYARLLKESQAVGVGFVDGDIELIWQKPASDYCS